MKHERIAATVPQDIPFYPDFINRELGGSKRWVLAQRLTPRVQNSNGGPYDVAIHPKRYADMQHRHHVEVTEAVRLQMLDLVEYGIKVGESPEDIVSELLLLPGVAILTDDYQRSWPQAADEKHRAFAPATGPKAPFRVPGQRN